MCTDIGKYIRLRRKELNMTQAMLAEKMNLSDSKSISAYELGKVMINADMLLSLSIALEVPVGYFFGESSDKSSDEEKKLLNTFRTMDNKTKQKAIEIFNILCA